MKLLKQLILICIFLFSIKMNAQINLPISKKYDGTSIGVGFGPDFSGYGIALMHYGSNKHVGIFGGVGYTPSGLALDGGIKLRLFSYKFKAIINPFLLGLYSYTKVVSITNDPQYNRIFYGPSLGIGYDFRIRPNSRGFWTFAMLFPLDNSKGKEYMQYLEDYKQVVFDTKDSNFRYSIGYRYMLN